MIAHKDKLIKKETERTWVRPISTVQGGKKKNQKIEMVKEVFNFPNNITFLFVEQNTTFTVKKNKLDFEVLQRELKNTIMLRQHPSNNRRFNILLICVILTTLFGDLFGRCETPWAPYITQIRHPQIFCYLHDVWFIIIIGNVVT